MPIITLTTDFGNQDTYVAQVKGVLLSLLPEVRLVDATHEVPAGEVRAGAYALESLLRHFPEGTLHLAVVDPGVGGDRRPLAVIVPTCMAVGPDNGLLTPVLSMEGAAAFEIRGGRFWHEDPAPIFHGRDLFAPACAHLLLGHPVEEMGPRVVDPVLLPPPAVRRHSLGVDGEILSIDHFGNLITSITQEDMAGHDPRSLRVEVGIHAITGLARTYAEGEGLIALFGSGGHLEIAWARGAAKGHVGAAVGDKVAVRW